MSSLIDFQHVYKTLGSKSILIDLNMQIPKGSLFGILGPNGAGKSTTLKLLTGRLKPSSGRIFVNGKDPWLDRVEVFEKIGYLGQNPTPPQDTTVLNFIKYMGRLGGFNKKEADTRGREVLGLVGLDKFEAQTIGKLSGGEQQRLGFANAILFSPSILVLDEPTASLDPEGRVYVMDLISNMAREKEQTVIVSSHILPEIQRMTNHIAIMNEGKVLVQGSMAELTLNIYDDEYEVETDNDEKMLELLKESGYEIEQQDGKIILMVNSNLKKVWREIPLLCVENELLLKSLKPRRDALENVFLQYVSRNIDREAYL